MLKKIFLLTLTCMLICAGVLAEGLVVEVDTVAELQQAMENAVSGTTIRLTKDLTITEPLGEYNQMYVYTDITLDMNGKTLRDERISVPRTINIRETGSLKIIGDGCFENIDHNSDFIQALGPLFIYSGHFSHDSFEWGNKDCPYTTDPNNPHWKNYRRMGYLISSYINDEYNGYVTVYNATFDPGTTNPEAVYAAYKMDVNPDKQCYFMYPLINEGNSYAHGVTIYGGEYVTANPANGEGNWCDSPKIEDPFYLNGQTELRVVPSPYSIVKSAGSDSRDIYTVDYPVSLTAVKKITNLTDEPVGLAGYKFELVNQSSGKVLTAVSDENGQIKFDLPLEDAEDTYTLREVRGAVLGMTYSNLEYEVTIVPGPRSERYKPVAQATLDGEVVTTPVFENVYRAADVPGTGDQANLMLYAALVLGGMLACILLRRRSWA